MDPVMFELNWDRVFETLTVIIVLAIFVERSLSLVFEHQLYVQKLSGKGLKAIIAFIVSFLICKYWDFDAISIIFARTEAATWGYLLTAGIIAGGSKGAIKLFQETMDWKQDRSDEKSKPKEITS